MYLWQSGRGESESAVALVRSIIHEFDVKQIYCCGFCVLGGCKQINYQRNGEIFVLPGPGGDLMRLSFETKLRRAATKVLGMDGHGLAWIGVFSSP